MHSYKKDPILTKISTHLHPPLTIQHSTMSVCNDSIKSTWDFSNWSDNQTLYGNFLGSASTSVQETSRTSTLAALGCSDKMEVINQMNLGTNQSKAPPERLVVTSVPYLRILNSSSNSNDRRKVSLKRAWGAFLPLAIDIIKCSAAQSSGPSSDGFQSDSQPEQRQCSRNDDEYPPSYPIGISDQQTPNPLPSGGRPTSTSESTSTPARPSKRLRTDRRTHGSAPSRNKQATSDQVEDIRVKLSHCRVNREQLKDLICPVIGCQYKQLNGRMPDFRRHIRTHIRKDGRSVVKVSLGKDFGRHRHLFPKVSMDQPPYAVPDEDGLWIGGCLKTFSRADALKRHLRNTSCVGLNHNRRR
jgi:hypothetical protein